MNKTYLTVFADCGLKFHLLFCLLVRLSVCLSVCFILLAVVEVQSWYEGWLKFLGVPSSS